MPVFASISFIITAFVQAFYEIWWVILPAALYFIFKFLYFDYVAFHSQRSHHRSLKWIFLEIVPPKDIEKGPKLMESVLHGISGVTTGPNTFDIWIKGFYTQDRFSLELFGENGQAHFIVRIQRKYRDLLEAHVYAQYPDAEIKEVEDYTLRFPKIIPNKKWDLWGTDFQFTNDIAFPIKTYDKFEEDITGTMIDPMSALMEVIGSLPPNQYIIHQFACEPMEEKWVHESGEKKIIDKLKGKGKVEEKGVFDHLMEVFSNIFAGLFGPVEFGTAEKKEEAPLEFRLSPLEKEQLKAVEEKMGRYIYKCKMRFIYLGHRDGFSKTFVSSFIGGIKQFGDQNFNSLKPQDFSKTYGKIFFKQATADFRKRRIYKRFKERNPDGAKVFLSSKELATMYHFPDMGVKSPSVPRVSSKVGTAPANLPIQ